MRLSGTVGAPDGVGRAVRGGGGGALSAVSRVTGTRARAGGGGGAD